MEYKALFGILSAILAILSVFPYLKRIQKGDVRPRIISWFGYTLAATLIGTSLFVESGNIWGVMLVAGNALAGIIVTAYLIISGKGIWVTDFWKNLDDKSDIVAISLCFFGLYVWVQSGMPIFGFMFGIGASIFFIKIYKYTTEQELIRAKAPVMLASIFSILSANEISFVQMIYPLYLIVFETLGQSFMIFMNNRILLNKSNEF